ncbi:hypothetical protein LZ554_006550 [Drepanopeziza brunnea f. sp. 'monogermtubi']|nr:hypothetical protein LZ554_006550 [Drepanopeziza brunnea f. sp. 'monogermtubi']
MRTEIVSLDESLLHTQYHIYEHQDGEHMVPACDSYDVPNHIQEHVDYIIPGNKLFAPVKRSLLRNGFRGISIQPDPKADLPPTVASDLSTCDHWITPACIKAFYKVPETPGYPDGRPRSDSALGILETGDTYAQEDLDSFFSNLSPMITNGRHPNLASIDGGTAPTDASDEGGKSALDLTLAYPLVYPPEPDIVSDGRYLSYCSYSAFGETGNDREMIARKRTVPKTNTLQPNLTLYIPTRSTSRVPTMEISCVVFTKSKYPLVFGSCELTQVVQPANVISVSYGGQESDLPVYYQQRQCNEFMKLGLQGVSLSWASGDSGAAGPRLSDREMCLGPKNTIFNPTWPNNYPYITNVGSTKIYPNHTPYSVAYSSGGGFSNLYPAPDYQKRALATYFRKHDPGYRYDREKASLGSHGALYNRLGRG